MGFFANRFPTLAKHGAVLRESWQQQGEADKAFKPKDDHEFLPAALEIMEKPPSPGLRWLMLLRRQWRQKNCVSQKSGGNIKNCARRWMALFSSLAWAPLAEWFNQPRRSW